MARKTNKIIETNETFDDQTEIRIAPILIFEKIYQDFDNYLEVLRNNEDEDLKNKFIEKFDNVYKQEIDMLR